MNLRIIARVIIYNPKLEKIILVRNKGASFWYPPGGGWEFDSENILEAAKREVKEEIGIDVEIGSFMYSQEFQESKETKYFETFWYAEYEFDFDEEHKDLDPNGLVEEIKYFSKEELSDLKVFPDRLKNVFWEDVKKIKNTRNPFIGIS